jgi:hypothetical protein
MGHHVHPDPELGQGRGLRADGSTAMITALVAVGIDEHAQRIEHEPIETYSNGVRHVNVPDPDGNAIAFAEPPAGASASPRSAGPGAPPG